MALLKKYFYEYPIQSSYRNFSGSISGHYCRYFDCPDSGKRTREKIVGKTKDLKNLMVDSIDDVKKAYNRESESLMNNDKSGIDSMKNESKV